MAVNGTKHEVDEERIAMGKYLNRRMVCTGTFVRFDIWEDRDNHREYPTARLDELEIDGHMVADHVWLHHAEELKGFTPKVGERVVVSAVVASYRRHKDGVPYTSYGLRHGQDYRFPDRRIVALTVPDLPPPTPPKPTIVAPPPVNHGLASKTLDAFSIIPEVKALAKKCGGYAKLKELITLLED